MSIPALNRTVTAANLPLEKLAGSTQVSQKEKLAEVSRQFEEVLLRQILAQSQKPLVQSSLAGTSGAGNAIYQDMISQQLADRISRGGSFGFAKVLEKQLDNQYIKKDHVPAQLKPLGAGPELKEFHMRPVAGPAESLAAKPAIKTHHVLGQPGKRI